MSSYRKTMREALEEMHDIAEDFKPHKMYDPKTGKAYDAKTMDDHLRMKKKGYDHEKPKDEDEDENEIDESLWANIAAKRKRIKAGSGETMRKKGDPGAPTSDQMAKAKNEEVELDEASKYDLYHKDFSGAMQHAYKMAKKLHGITISPDEISDKVATGPRKPSEGKTNKYRLEGDKGAIQVQVYNKGGSKPYELNFYKEEVELDEAQKWVVYNTNNGKLEKEFSNKIPADRHKDKLNKKYEASGKLPYRVMQTEEIELDEDVATMGAIVMGLNAAALLPVLFMAVREIIRGTPLESSIKNVVDKLKKNKNYKMSDSEKSDVTGFVSKVKKDKPSLLQKAVKQAKLNLLKDQSHEEVEEGAAADARRAMRNDPDMKQRAFSKDVSSTDDDEKAASKNIMMQLRKAVSLRSYDVEFADGKKQKVNQKIAQAVQNKYNSMRRPADKEKFQAQIAKSYKDMLKTIKSGYGEQKESILEKIDRKIKENKNG